MFIYRLVADDQTEPYQVELCRKLVKLSNSVCQVHKVKKKSGTDSLSCGFVLFENYVLTDANSCDYYTEGRLRVFFKDWVGKCYGQSYDENDTFHVVEKITWPDWNWMLLKLAPSNVADWPLGVISNTGFLCHGGSLGASITYREGVKTLDFASVQLETTPYKRIYSDCSLYANELGQAVGVCVTGKEIVKATEGQRDVELGLFEELARRCTYCYPLYLIIDELKTLLTESGPERLELLGKLKASVEARVTSDITDSSDDD